MRIFFNLNILNCIQEIVSVTLQNFLFAELASLPLYNLNPAQTALGKTLPKAADFLGFSLMPEMTQEIV